MKQSQTREIAGPLFAIALLAFVAPAWAHDGPHGAGGFVAGVLHPILGWDHLVAMVAVGIWSACLGAPALRVLPLLFPLVMTAGASLGMAGIGLPGVEAGIAASAIVLGAAVLATLRAPVPVAMLAVGAFAILHGYAHGTELPHTANAASYSAGFVVATGLLHLAGVGIGGLVRFPSGRIAVRALGGAIALTGTAFLARVI